MGYIFRFLESTDLGFINMTIKNLSTNRQVLKEMGEPLIVEENQSWIFCYESFKLVGFCAYTDNKILYFYTIPEFRNNGVFNELYNKLPLKEWTVIASNDSYPIFLKKGFKVVKNYKNCHKLIKKI